MNTSRETCLVAILSLIAALSLAMPARAELRQADDPPSDSRITQPAEAEETTNPAPKEGSSDTSSQSRDSGALNRDTMVVFGQNVELKAGETAEVVVVIGGSAKIHGKVRQGVVAVGGDVEVDGEVGQQVVAVMGSIRLAPGAVVHQDVVSVGGKLDVAPDAKVEGHAQEVAIAGLKLPHADWIRHWLEQCVFMLRPLSPRVGWVWGVAFVYFLLFLLIAAVFRHPVEVCRNELERRPATTFIIGLLTKLFLPLLILILIMIVIGIVVIPFVAAALFVLSLVGKVAVLEWIGFKLGRAFGKKPVEQPVVALVMGSAVLALLYIIPVIGLLAMLLLSVWSLGCAVTATFGGFRRELPEKQAVAAAASIPAPAMAAAAPPTIPSMPANSVPAAVRPSQSAGTPLTTEPPVMPDTLTHPKATFWERMAAGFLDLVLVTILGAIVQGPPLALIVALAYFTGLWAWRGTSIGGIVLGLKVVRADGEPVSFAVALVRALAAAFSGIVLFLGFFWIAWDSEKQGWHDKIAGTVVLKLPRGTPLLCL